MLVRIVFAFSLFALGLISQPVFSEDRVSPPSAEDQKELSETVREVYGDEYDLAKSSPQREAFAKKLLETGKESTDSTEQYVLLRVARDAAIQNSSVDLAMEIISELSTRFEVDQCAMQASALTQMAGKCRDTNQALRVSHLLLPIIESSIVTGDLKFTSELLPVLETAARRSRDGQVFGKHQDLKLKLDALSKAYPSVVAARKVLTTSPEDAEANQTIGEYCCFLKGDWPTGLPHLAKGTDQTLKALADLDLDASAVTSSQIELGDQWWKYADQFTGSKQTSIRHRAVFLYKKAVDAAVSDLTHDRLLHRIKQVEPDYETFGETLAEAFGAVDLKPPGSDEQPNQEVKPGEEPLTIELRQEGRFTLVPLKISQQVKLPVSGSPYALTGHALVAEDGELLIERGSEVFCVPGSSIEVNGVFQSYQDDEEAAAADNGKPKPEEYVQFSPGRSGTSWRGLKFMGCPAQTLDYFDIRGAVEGIHVDSGIMIDVSNSILAFNKDALFISYRAKLSMHQCVVTNSQEHGMIGKMMTASFTHCTFSANDTAIALNYNGNIDMRNCTLSKNKIGISTNLYSTSAKLRDCNITQNLRSIVLDKGATSDVDCTGCYWGTTDPRAISAMIHDGRDDPELEIVRIDSSVEEPIQDCGWTAVNSKERKK